MRAMDIDFQCEDTRGIQIGIEIGNESDGYRFAVGGCSGDAVRY